jgi:hypothetical protein
MGQKEEKQTVTLGGWYQRTTLHLTEVYDLFSEGTTRLPLEKKKLAVFHKALNLRSVTREAGLLDCVHAETRDGIRIRYYEDGLYVLELVSGDVPRASKQLQSYFQDVFQPAVSYIFSLGAPTPKVLANIETIHPVVVTTQTSSPSNYAVDPRIYGTVYQKISSGSTTVFKTETHIIIAAKQTSSAQLRDLIELQIFFREFKDQLAKYLSIHRTIWEKIAEIKERGSMKLKDTQKLRAILEGYNVTIDLIESRISQMGSYVSTRASIAKETKLEVSLRLLFEYRFEALLDTLAYIKDLWKMTQDYLTNAIQVIVEIQNQGTKTGIQSLRAVTTFGVFVTALNFTWQNANLEKVTMKSVLIVLIVLGVAWALDRAIQRLSEQKEFRLKFKEGAKL